MTRVATLIGRSLLLDASAHSIRDNGTETGQS